MRNFLIASLIFYALSFIVSFIYRGRGGRARLREEAASASKWLLVTGFLSHLLALAIIVRETGHAPMANIYESLVFFSWTIALVSLIVIFRYDERQTGLITVPAAVAALLFAFAKEVEGGPLTLILRTRWFETHVMSSFAAYALFTLAFSAALLFLITKARCGRNADERLLKKLQEIAARSVLWGFLLFSFSMFSGAVWGYLAWGAYWMWEPKIIWSFIVWFYYAGTIHAYYVKEWRGTGLCIATAFGIFVVLFTFLGVGLMMKSSHSF